MFAARRYSVMCTGRPSERYEVPSTKITRNVVASAVFKHRKENNGYDWYDQYGYRDDDHYGSYDHQGYDNGYGDDGSGSYHDHGYAGDHYGYTNNNHRDGSYGYDDGYGDDGYGSYHDHHGYRDDHHGNDNHGYDDGYENYDGYGSYHSNGNHGYDDDNGGGGYYGYGGYGNDYHYETGYYKPNNRKVYVPVFVPEKEKKKSKIDTPQIILFLAYSIWSACILVAAHKEKNGKNI